MKHFKFLPLIVALSNVAVAQQTSIIEASEISRVSGTEQAVVEESIIPQLSFESQQARATALAKQEDIIQQEEERRIAAEKLTQIKERIAQEVVGNRLVLTNNVAQIYAENDFTPMWSDKIAQKTFLKEYAAFAASGVSQTAIKSLQQILNSEGLARDILLTDSFLDYLYYNKNVSANANKWLYNLGSYTTKAPADSHISSWVAAVKKGDAAQFVTSLVPRNHIYQETISYLFSMAPGETHTTKGKKGKNAGTVNSTTFEKLALNAQRLRLIPSFNNGIFVNIPSYQLYYFRDGKQVLQSKVIVGRDERRTPVMYSKLSNVVVNPPWNVPPTIKNKDLVPKFARNPNLVESSGYEILDGKGNKVNPHSIAWSNYVGKTNFPYHIRQKAGDDSALGRYKFNMPSSDAIFLHDTPNRSLFGKNNRALSSGCVRVAKADELATLLLKEAGWSENKKQNVLSSKKTTSAPIRSDNPVYIYYVTAWVEDGKMYTLPDIYHFDKHIPKMSIDWVSIKNVI